jgi:DivIVA domain-containing protein
MAEEGDTMPSAELDVPLVPSAEQIRRRMFASVRRGFDPDQVRDYLEQIADQVERLERELKEVRLAAEVAEAKAADLSASQIAQPAEPHIDPFKDLGSRVADVLRSADEQAHKLTEDARREADRLLGDARGEADRVRTDAQARAERDRAQGAEALRRAREEADRALGGIASRRESLLRQLQEMQGRLIGVATELEEAVLRTDADSPTASDSGTAPGGDATSEAPPSSSASGTGPAPLDPKYEDLWASGETVDLTEIPSLEIDIDEEPAEGEERR